MPEYQVIARKFRPQRFKDVVGQEAIVTTLKNALKFKRLAQAYLFCGSRGTGKTTLARIFAKALNCQQLTEDFEPCNQCSSCREITAGSSLDVLEIDGASHRGIEDIRQINETVGYATASGHYKVYIIDEVHMLTKEAFNALLKTLEEPPPKVKFFFATTEPHKVLPTILSRCQRYNLNRIPAQQIVAKLLSIAQQLGVEVEEEALRLVAQRAEGGLRDAESLFDQIIAFSDGKIEVSAVSSILGLMPRTAYFELDQAGKEGQFTKAFEIAHRIFSEGKDILHFIEGLIEHFRTILLVKLSGRDSPLLSLSMGEKEQYEITARLYSKEQCLDLIDYLIEAQNQIRFSTCVRIALEAVLLHVMRSHFRLPIEQLVQRLSEIEEALGPMETAIPTPLPQQKERSAAVKTESPMPKLETPVFKVAPPSPAAQIPSPAPKPDITPIAKTAPAPQINPHSSISEDPTPTLADLGKRKEPTVSAPKPVPTAIIQPKAQSPETGSKQVHQYDTLLHFAAIELEGKLQKK